MKFRLGINYWPISSAMYWWQRFDAAEVDRDFARIREAGFDSVRIFLLWEDFQPTPQRLSSQALDHLVAVANAAARNGLSIIPTLFTGHMSGVNWIPEWALEAGETHGRFRVVAGGKVVNARLKNWYTNESVLEAQCLLAREVANTLARHPALWAYDLGNENSNCVVPPSNYSAIVWLEAITEAIRKIDSTHPITIGLHMEDLEEDRHLGPAEAGRICDFLCMHGYPIYADWADSPTASLMLPFLGLLTRWLGGRDVLFEEFGVPSVREKPRQTNSPMLLQEDQAARFIQESLEDLHGFGLLGGMIWCYGDYAKWLWSWPPLDRAEHERYFGLWRNTYSAKPAVSVLARFKNSERAPAIDDFAWIDIEPGRYYLDPSVNIRRLYRSFRKRFSDVPHK